MAPAIQYRRPSGDGWKARSFLHMVTTRMSVSERNATTTPSSRIIPRPGGSGPDTHGWV